MHHFDTLGMTDDWKVLGGSALSQAALMTLEPGQSGGGPENRHEESDQWLYVISGRAGVTVEGQEVALKSGGLILIQAGERHEVRALGEEQLVTLNFYAPPEY